MTVVVNTLAAGGSEGLGAGTVTSVSVTTANGVSGSVATATTTPAISLSLDGITPTSVNGVVLSGSATPTLAVTGTSSVSGANTGDQSSVSGNAGTATALQTARLINGTSFNGTSDITVAAAAGTLTGATLAAGVTASSLTSVGTLASLTVSGAISTGTALTVTDSAFTLADNGDATKIAKFECSGITTGTTRTYTLPNATVTLAALDLSSQAFSGTALTFGNSAQTTTYSFASGATFSGNTKTVNVGTGGLASSTTTVNI